MHQKQQLTYLRQAKEISQLHYEIITNIHQTTEVLTNNHIITFSNLQDDIIEATVSGKHNFTVWLTLNLDNMRIKAYNYTGF
jgi:hypothetical protein